MSDCTNIMGKGIYFCHFDEDKGEWVITDAAGRECCRGPDKSVVMEWAIERITVLAVELAEPIKPGGPLRNYFDTDPKNGDIVVTDYETGAERARGATLPQAWLALIGRTLPKPSLSVTPGLNP